MAEAQRHDAHQLAVPAARDAVAAGVGVAAVTVLTGARLAQDDDSDVDDVDVHHEFLC